ncbi:MAG: hypothetical protein AAF851_15445 [Myxococcota bacterium]
MVHVSLDVQTSAQDQAEWGWLRRCGRICLDPSPDADHGSALAISYHLLAILRAALGVLPSSCAALVMMASSASATLNALRIGTEAEATSGPRGGAGGADDDSDAEVRRLDV